MHKIRKYTVPLASTPTAAPGYGTGHLSGSFELKRPAVVVSVRPYLDTVGAVTMTALNALGNQGGVNPEGLRLIGTDKLLPVDAQYSLHMLDLRDFESPAGVYDIRINGIIGNANTAMVIVLELDYSGFEG